MNQDEISSEMILQGIPVYPGIEIGKAHVVDQSRIKILYQYLVRDEQVQAEAERFDKAVCAVEDHLLSLKNRMPDRIREQSFILDSHLMILNDSMLRGATRDRILAEKINAEWAIKKSLEEITRIFSQIDDEYIRQRISDVENVAGRVLRTLSGEEQHSLTTFEQRAIIVAHDLSPGDTTELNPSRVLGFITDVGGRTSHTAIMAQALEIPAVVGLETATSVIHEGDLLIVDGATGQVIVNPDDSAIILYQEKKLNLEKYRSSIARMGHLPAETLDGYHIVINANIEFLEEVAAVRDYGGEAVGLYRTEFLYLRCKGFPREDELLEDYREVAEIMYPGSVSIRTLDLGGDKFSACIEAAEEMNPALGLRAIRFCLRQPEIFKTQLRAILRASAFGKIHLIFPMISGLQEILDAKAILGEVKQDLDQEGIPYDRDMKVGIMMEIPSAVVMAESLAHHVDFFSIGTNDLIQYALAIDRVNEQVANMYQPFHPAILRMIRQVVLAGREAGIPVSLCGEMAGDPLCLPLLLCLGLDALSMNARAIPLIKKMVRSVSMAQVCKDLEGIWSLHTAQEIRKHIVEKNKSLFPELYEQGFLGE